LDVEKRKGHILSAPNPVEEKNDKSTQLRNETGSVTTSAVIFALGTLLSRILGLVRDMMTARYFPPEVRDAFLAAFRLPNLFRRVLGEGSMSISFIPVFVDLLRGNRRDEAHQLVNSVFAILMTVSISLSLLGILFMDDVLRVVLSGDEYMRIEGKFEMTVTLARIMFSFLILMSLFAFFMAILNSLKQFALSALAPCLLNLSLISAALISDRWAAPESVLAWSVLIGGILQMGLLVPSVIRAGFFPKPSLLWNTPEVKRVMKAIVPSIFGMSIMQITQMVNLHFASHLPQGTISAFYLADRVLELPLSIFVVSVGSALLPTLARYWSERDLDSMSATINHYVRLILFVSIPAAVGMFALARPITEVLFQGKEFRLEDTVMTASIIQVYAFSLLVSGGVRLLAQGFYAVQNTWFPALAAATSVAAHVFLAAMLTEKFGIVGLASATVASAALNLTLLVSVYHFKIASLRPLHLIKGVLQFAMASVVMWFALGLYEVLLANLGQAYLSRVIALAVTIALGAFSYFGAAHLLGVPEYHETKRIFLEKAGRKLSRLRVGKSA